MRLEKVSNHETYLYNLEWNTLPQYKNVVKTSMKTWPCLYTAKLFSINCGCGIIEHASDIWLQPLFNKALQGA
jgi:hypothetical protein